MGFLVLGALLLFGFIAFAPEEVQRIALTLAWAGGALAIVVSVLGSITWW